MRTGNKFPAADPLRPRPGSLGRLLLTLGVLVALSGAEVRGQEGFVSGVVVDAQSLEPLAGAQVLAVGTDRGTVTDARGRFLIQGLSGPEVTLRVVMLGYREQERAVGVGDANVRLALTESAIELDAVVVTGTAGATEKRQLGNAIATIEADDVVEIAPIVTTSSLINGRAPGVVIQTGTGMVGAGPRIRIRGASSFSLSDQPLLYVDGVRVNNEVASGLTIQAFGSAVISRINDINPNDIASIEIIKGPAAATLYGTEAANGVIQIITKRGQPSEEPRVSLTIRQGASWFNDPAERIGTTYWRNPETGEVESLNIVEAERERGTPIFSTGHNQGYSASVSGGSAELRYYISADYDDNEGIEPINYMRRFSGRLNLTANVTESLQATASLGLTDQDTGLAFEAGAGGIWFSTMFNTPALKDTPKRGFLFNPPETIWPVLQPKQFVNRFTGSLNLTHSPAGWFDHRLTVGADMTHEQDESVVERITDPYIAQFYGPGTIDGGKFIRSREVDYHSFDYGATASFDLADDVASNTSVGAQYYRRFVQAIAAEGDNFPAPDLRTVDALAVTFGGDDYFENATVGVYGQQQFGWRDRAFVTVALRADDNSAFGENFDLVYYPKVSGSWVISEEPFWDFGWVNTLRLRAAYGESGQQPETFAALRTFSPITSGSGGAAVTPDDPGNPDLAPERGQEIELGFDAGFLNDRIGLELTYYDQKTEDAILLKDFAPSEGFPGAQFVNIGALKNSGLELQLNALALDTRVADVDLTFNFSTNESEVLDLGGEDFIPLGSQRHQIGFPVAAWFQRKVVSADLDANGRAINLMCDGGRPATSGGPPLLLGGEPIPCDDAPRLYLGRSSPNYDGSFSTTVTLFDRVQLYALADFKYGQKYFDNNLRARCQIFLNCLENMFPERYDPARIAEMQSSGQFVSFVINDAGFTRLREVSASYTLPASWAGWLGASQAAIRVAGRNLHLWTDWTGLDPESFFVGNLHTRLEQDNTPQLRQFMTTVQLTF
ncbi:MAG: SusC/RagA family TonB-linked outer membrane protein [Longimicrobiales bacterium]